MQNGKDLGRNVIPFPKARTRPKTDVDDGGTDAPAVELPKRRGIVDRIVHFKSNSGLVSRAIGIIPSWVTPNGVTLFRGALIVPVAALLAAGRYWWALGLLAFAMLLDFVDGALAQLRDLKSETGAFLDPLADKVLVCGTLLMLLPTLPAWARVPVLPICLFAAALTGVRIIRMAKNSHRRDTTPKSVAASPTGKMKMLSEVGAVLLLILGLALGAHPVVFIGGLLLYPAAVLGGLSLGSQITR